MSQHYKFSPSLVVHLPTGIVTLPANKFPNKLAPIGPNDKLRNPPFYSLASFFILSQTLLNLILQVM